MRLHVERDALARSRGRPGGGKGSVDAFRRPEERSRHKVEEKGGEKGSSSALRSEAIGSPFSGSSARAKALYAVLCTRVRGMSRYRNDSPNKVQKAKRGVIIEDGKHEEKGVANATSQRKGKALRERLSNAAMGCHEGGTATQGRGDETAHAPARRDRARGGARNRRARA